MITSPQEAENYAKEEVETTSIVKAEKEGPMKLVEALQEISAITVRNENGTFTVAVKTEADYTTAEVVKKTVEKEYKRIWDDMTPTVDQAHQLHKSLVARRGAAVAPYDALKVGIIAGNKAYLRAEETRKEEERKKLEAIAKKEAEEKALAEAAAMEAEAAQLKADGFVEEANAMIKEATQIIDEPAVYVAPVVMSQGPKVDKRTYGIKYSAKVTDKMKFIRFIALNPALQYLVDILAGPLNKYASSQKEAFNVPGAELVKE